MMSTKAETQEAHAKKAVFLSNNAENEVAVGFRQKPIALSALPGPTPVIPPFPKAIKAWSSWYCTGSSPVLSAKKATSLLSRYSAVTA
ncbi:MAG: hypothetical protein IPM83_12755 [Ignavibacteria bacterium]|nr:hypothetical protein [Ignavibacteria bacterium]